MSCQGDFKDRRPLAASNMGDKFYSWFDPRPKPANWTKPTPAQVTQWFQAETASIIACCKDTNAQGVLFRNLGLERSANRYIDLIGDPRVTNPLFPHAAQRTMMDAIRAAGYKIFVTLRTGVRVRDETGAMVRMESTDWAVNDLLPKFAGGVAALGPIAGAYIDTNIYNTIPYNPAPFINFRNIGGFPADKFLFSFELWRAPRDNVNRGWNDSMYFDQSAGYFCPNFNQPPARNTEPDPTKPPVWSVAPFDGAQPQQHFYLIHPLPEATLNELHRQVWIDALRWGHLPLVSADGIYAPCNAIVKELRAQAGLT